MHRCHQKVEYSLTEFGKSLMPVVLNLGEWADAKPGKDCAQ